MQGNMNNLSSGICASILPSVPMGMTSAPMEINYISPSELEQILSKILGTKTSEELKEIKKIYSNYYGRNLDNDVAMNTSGDFQRILLALLQCKGSSSLTFNKERCKSDAEKLYKLGEDNWAENIELIYNIFTTRSPSDLSQIYQYFKAKAGKGIMSAIAKEFSGNTYSLLSRIISSRIYSSQYFADSIHRIISQNLPNNNLNPNTQNMNNGVNNNSNKLNNNINYMYNPNSNNNINNNFNNNQINMNTNLTNNSNNLNLNSFSQQEQMQNSMNTTCTTTLTQNSSGQSSFISPSFVKLKFKLNLNLISLK